MKEFIFIVLMFCWSILETSLAAERKKPGHGCTDVAKQQTDSSHKHIAKDKASTSHNSHGAQHIRKHEHHMARTSKTNPTDEPIRRNGLEVSDDRSGKNHHHNHHHDHHRDHNHHHHHDHHRDHNHHHKHRSGAAEDTNAGETQKGTEYHTQHVTQTSKTKPPGSICSHPLEINEDKSQASGKNHHHHHDHDHNHHRDHNHHHHHHHDHKHGPVAAEDRNADEIVKRTEYNTRRETDTSKTKLPGSICRQSEPNEEQNQKSKKSTKRVTFNHEIIDAGQPNGKGKEKSLESDRGVARELAIEENAPNIPPNQEQKMRYYRERYPETTGNDDTMLQYALWANINENISNDRGNYDHHGGGSSGGGCCCDGCCDDCACDDCACDDCCDDCSIS